LKAVGLSSEDAAIVADVYTRASLKGASRITLIHRNKAVENYEGDNGLGELHGAFAAKRAIELAREFGAGICTIRNCNHILACAPFSEIIAEAGMLGYVLTRGAPTMGAPGRIEKVIGTAPQSFAAPKKRWFSTGF
jgi:LDH2 family malate/lactate/ureidoglycolate dehydrogenase